MIKTGFFWRTLLAGFALVVYVGCSSEMKEASREACVAPKVVADYVHAIIEADRTLYASLVVERMQHHGKALASEDWARRTCFLFQLKCCSLQGLRWKGREPA